MAWAAVLEEKGYDKPQLLTLEFPSIIQTLESCKREFWETQRSGHLLPFLSILQGEIQRLARHFNDKGSS